jgi:nitrite reductase/ring-hydroxylating ferredoxin subunit
MPGDSAFAAIVTRSGGRRWIAQDDIVPAVNAGQVILIPGVLRRLGIVDEVVETILGAVRDGSGSAPADEVRRRGLERIHEVLDGARIEATLHQAHLRLALRYPSFTKAVGVAALGLRHPFYVHRSPMLRFMTPHEVAARNAARFTRDENLGRLHPHAPHQDHWFGVPINAVNVWMAISAVEADNGVSIFADAWTAELPKDGLHVRRDQYLGEPVRVACDAGDLVVFHNRHAHGSVLNITQATRFTITTRLCVERPVAQTVNVLDGGCLYSPLVGTRFERYARAATRLSWVYMIERAKERVATGITAVETRVGGAVLQNTGRLARRALRYRRGDLVPHVPPAIQRRLEPHPTDDMAEGEILPVDGERCAARINGQLFIFGRRCPHEGGDFAAGYVKDGRVHCPRHNYWIDPKTGRGPCASLEPVRTYTVERLRA